MATPVSGSVQMSAESAPRFQVKLVHGPSGTVINTEAPRDNGGTGGSFSPTDLVGAALASCAMTTMALAASREGIPWGQSSARIEKRMTSAPRQIAELSLEIEMPAGLSPSQRTHLEEVGKKCPVARSIHPDVSLPMAFKYPD
jgi:putative redox protein